MLGNRRRRGFSKTARSHRHPRRHPWQTLALVPSHSTDAIAGDGVLAQAAISSPTSMTASVPWTSPATAQG